MKKTLISFVFLTTFGIINTQAQITINSSDVVVIGDVVEQASDTIPTGITIGSAGANQSWDFSTLGEDEFDTLFFQSPSPLPGSSSFPLSNLGMTESGSDSTWIFLTKDASGLYIDGLAQYIQGDFATIPFNYTLITFPSTMGTSFNTTWNGTLFTMPLGIDPDGPGPLPIIDSIKITRESSLISNIDGWGNVTTPLGTFSSLRQVSIEENIDYTSALMFGFWSVVDTAYDTIRTARWWTNNPGTKFPIVEIEFNTDSSTNNVTWLRSTPWTGIERLQASPSFSIFPTIASDYLNISYELEKPMNTEINLYNVFGKKMAGFKELSGSKTAGSHHHKMDLRSYNLAAGIYFLNFRADNHKQTITFIIE